MRPVRIACIALILALLATSGCGACKRFGYQGFSRDDWQKPDEVISLLGIRAGDRVADIGAGGGYFTWRLADAVGPEGRVYAVDVDDDMLEYLRETAREEQRRNVEVVHGELDDPLLPDGEIDLVFTSNTFHHIEDPTAYFRDVIQDLKPKGRVAILELNGASWFSSLAGHNTAKDEIVERMTEAGYTLTYDYDLVDRQSFLVFAVEGG